MAKLETNEALAALIVAAENMLHTLPLVPTAPLMEAQAMVERLTPNGMPDEWSDAMVHLADAMECVEWSFWPPGEYGSRQAHVSIDNLETVAECLSKLKKEIADAGQD